MATHPATDSGPRGRRATSVIAGVVGAGCMLLSASASVAQSAAELPTLVTAYAGVLRHAPQLELGQAPAVEALRALDVALARLDRRVEFRTRIASVSDVFVLPKVRGQTLRWLESRAGLGQRDSTHTLVVTEPLLALMNEGVAIVLSSRTPARTTLITLNSRLDASLVYDSFLAKGGAGTVPLGLLSGVGLNPEGDLVLYERDPPARGTPGRTALLMRPTAGNLTFRISER